MTEATGYSLEKLLMELRARAPALEIFQSARHIETTCTGGDNQDQVLIEIYRECLARGLTYSTSPENFLEASQRLSRLLFRYGREREANNYLLYLRDLSGEKPVPEWVFSYTAKLEYMQDLAFTIQHPAVVLRPISEVLALNPEDRQAHAVLADFVISAATLLIQDPVQADVNDFSDALDMFLEEHSSIGFPNVRRALQTIDAISESVSSPALAEGPEETILWTRASAQPENETSDISAAALRQANTEIERQLAESRAEATRLGEQIKRFTEENEALRKALADASAVQQHAVTTESPIQAPASPTAAPPPKVAECILPPRSRILVLGNSTIAEHKLWGICKQLGLGKEQVEFALEYDAFDRIGFRNLKYNNSIAGIMVGPVPHKVPGCDDPANTLQKEEGYPPTVKVESSNGELKITKSSFRAALEKLLVRIASNEPVFVH